MDLNNARDISFSMTALRIDLSSVELSLQASTLSDGSKMMFSDLQLSDSTCAVVLASNEPEQEFVLLGTFMVHQTEMIGSENSMSTFNVEWTTDGSGARSVLLTALEEFSISKLSIMQVDCAAVILINVAGMVYISYDTEFKTSFALDDMMYDLSSVSDSDSVSTSAAPSAPIIDIDSASTSAATSAPTDGPTSAPISAPTNSSRTESSMKYGILSQLCLFP